MRSREVCLDRFDNSWYKPGRPRLVQAAWFFVGAPLLGLSLLPGSGFRRVLLRIFGAKVGHGVVVKPRVRVKYPWRLELGDHVWLGEGCWIDNLANVSIGADCCVSQEAYLCTGNHDWSDPAFGLIAKTIVLEPGSWVGARSVIGPGVRLAEYAIAAAGSVITKDVPAFEIHAGNPAGFVRRRVVGEACGLKLAES